MISSNDKSLSLDPSALESALGAQHLVLVVYYPDYLKKVCAITAYLANLGKISSVVIVINNLAIPENALSGLFSGSLASVKVIRHDNIGFEFGAYQRGIDEIRKSEDQPFDVIVMNDTVGTHQRIDQLYLRNFRDTVRTRPVRSIVGNTDSVPRRLDVNGLYCVRWVRSNLFYIDHAALASINHTIYVPGIDDLILGGPTEAEFYSQDVSPSLKHHISSWLFGKGALAWYKAQPLSAENCTRMAFKARCILQELYLSMRLEAADTHFLPPIPLRFYEKAAVTLGYANL